MYIPGTRLLQKELKQFSRRFQHDFVLIEELHYSSPSKSALYGVVTDTLRRNVLWVENHPVLYHTTLCEEMADL